GGGSPPGARRTGKDAHGPIRQRPLRDPRPRRRAPACRRHLRAAAGRAQAAVEVRRRQVAGRWRRELLRGGAGHQVRRARAPTHAVLDGAGRRGLSPVARRDVHEPQRAGRAGRRDRGHLLRRGVRRGGGVRRCRVARRFHHAVRRADAGRHHAGAARPAGGGRGQPDGAPLRRRRTGRRGGRDRQAVLPALRRPGEFAGDRQAPSRQRRRSRPRRRKAPQALAL
ncbi:MAG: FIG00582348: hypothetical protein, partial [uncultured Ramlibacter sp.]